MKDDTLPEPDGYMYQHDETGQVGFCDVQQVEWGFEANNPRLRLTDPLYTAATLRQAVKRANYALLMRLHEENKHKHNYFHCAAVKLMEESK